MLRSGSVSIGLRLWAYGFTALAAGVFVYGVFEVMRVAVESTDSAVRFVLAFTALLALGLVGAVTVGAARSRHTGGHFLVGLACLAGTFVSFVGLLMVAF